MLVEENARTIATERAMEFCPRRAAASCFSAGQSPRRLHGYDGPSAADDLYVGLAGPFDISRVYNRHVLRFNVPVRLLDFVSGNLRKSSKPPTKLRVET